MRFTDRRDAGSRLAKKLKQFRGRHDAIVVALPRGGVVPGRIIADVLGLPLDIVVPRKIGAPEDQEFAIGAVTEKGDIVWNEAEHERISHAYADMKIAEQKKEAQRRLTLYRAGMADRDLNEKTAIIVDDGIATGLTMRAAIATVKAEGAKRVIVAVPVVPKEALVELVRIVDEVVAVHVPESFAGSIGVYYDTFAQVDDEQVVKLMH